MKKNLSSPLERRNQIAPQMEDYDQIGRRWFPYLMIFHNPSKVFPSVSTDQHGFRTTMARDEKSILPYEDFFGPANSTRNILLGSSSAFGVGATHDKYTIPSFLNRMTSSSWFNFGARNFSSTQEALLFFFHFHKKLNNLVIFSGINNLILSYLSSNTSPIYNSFFFQSMFERSMELQLNEIMGVRKSFKRLIKELKYKISPHKPHKGTLNIDAQYNSIIECFKRDMTILKGLSMAYKFPIYFAFQPIATWIDKELSLEEIEIFNILDQLQNDWKILAEHILSHKNKYINDTKVVCDQLEIPFYDINSSPQFKKKEWLFVDRVHLTDRGYEYVSEIIKGEFHL